MKNIRNLINKILILTLFSLHFSCIKKSKKIDEVDICKQCADSAAKFYSDSQYEDNISFYDNKVEFKRLRFLLYAGCSRIDAARAGYEIFFSYLHKNNSSKNSYDIKKLSLEDLSEDEINEVIYALEAGCNGNINVCIYTLGLFYLNGKYVNKDIEKGQHLLKKCTSLKFVARDFFYHRIDVNSIDSLYFVPKEYNLSVYGYKL